MPVRGCGIDLVHVPGFAEQLAQPGTRFTRVFHASELRLVQQRGLDGVARAWHLAGRWAAKEAWIKAWSQALFGQPPVLAEHEVDFREIVVQADPWGRVRLRLRHGLRMIAAESLALNPEQLDAALALSISHDGDYATAVCIIADTPHR
ncbi:holo-ACP synthase AcpS [Corynebacterium ciconiae]|uniref:holo-ACP synthase AcpS n=1 Tax=Corynebacterium ciconiae TaxID=227319 RepID=UPI0004759517|nr:holo-ACP synthase [Corynebacterium ciconiae]